MPKKTINAYQAQDKVKGKKKKEILTADDLAIASFVFNQGDSAYKNAGSDMLGYDGYVKQAGESDETEAAMRQRAQELIDHLNEIRYGEEGSYSERVGEVEVETSKLANPMARSDIHARNVLSGKLRNLFGDRISNYVAFGASFSEYGRARDAVGDYQQMFTNQLMDVAPGVSIDAKSIELRGNRNVNDRKDITIRNIGGGISPRLTLFTGVTGSLMELEINEFRISGRPGNARLYMQAGRGDTRPLVERLSSHLTRRINFDTLTINTFVPEGFKMGNPVVNFDNAQVSYQDDLVQLEGLNDRLKRAQNNAPTKTQFVTGSGVIIKDNVGEDVFTGEREQINTDNAAEALNVPVGPAVNAVVQEAERKEYKTQAEIDAEKKKKAEEEEFEAYHFDPLQHFDGIGKVKGLSGEISGNEKGQTKISLSASGNGDMLEYRYGVKKYENFFDFLVGNTSITDKDKLTSIKQKVSNGEELTYGDALFLENAVSNPSIAEQVGAIFGRTFLGEFWTSLGEDILSWIRVNNQEGLEGSDMQDMLLRHFLGDHLTNVLEEFISGSDEDKPTLDYLGKYIKDLLGLSKDSEGNTVKPFEDKESQTNIVGFPYQFDEDAMKKAKLKKEAHPGTFALRSVILPGVIAGFSFAPFFTFAPTANLSVEPSGVSFGEAKKAFRDDVYGKGISPEDLKKSDLEESFKKCYKDVGYVVKPSVGAQVSAGIKASAFIMAGLGMILSLKGQLEGVLKGNASMDIGGAFKLTAPDGYLKLSGLTGAHLKGGLSASGEVSLKAGIASELLSWELNVIEIQLLKAALKELSIGVDISLGEGDGKQDFANFGVIGAASFEGLGFQKAIQKEGAEKFSVEKQEMPRGMQTMLDEASNFNGGFNELKTKVESIIRVLTNPGNISAIGVGGAPSFNQLKTVLGSLADTLKQRNDDLKESALAIKNMKEGYVGAKDYKKKSDFINDRIKKHEDLRDRMTAFNQARDGDPLKYYKKGRFFDGQTDFEKYLKNKKVEEYARETVHTAAGVDKKRYEILLENKLAHDLEKNNAIKTGLDNYDPNAVPPVPFHEYYNNLYIRTYGKNNSSIYEHMGVSDTSRGSKKRLLDFEKSRSAKKTKEYRDNLADIRNYISENKLDPMTPSEQFSKWYFKKFLKVTVLTRGTWLRRQAVDYLSPKMLLEVLRRKISKMATESNGDSNFDRLLALERFNDEYKACMDRADKALPNSPERNAALTEAKRIASRARQLFFRPNGKTTEFMEHFYRTGTKVQILEYEKSWVNDKRVSNPPPAGGAGGAVPRNGGTQMEKRAALLTKINGFLNGKNGIEDVSDTDKNSMIADLRNNGLLTGTHGAKLTKIGFWKDRSYEDHYMGVFNHIGNFFNLIDQGSKSSIGKRRDLIAQNVTLDTILRYERRRSQDRNLAEKERTRHAKVLAILKGQRAVLMNEKDPERVKKILEDLRKDYFSGKIDLNADASYTGYDHKQLITDIESGKESDFAVLAAILKKDQDSYKKVHDKRSKEVSEMLENNPMMSDVEAYYKYHDQIRDYLKIRRAVNYRGGYEDYVKSEFLKREGLATLDANALKKVSIEELIRYEKRTLAEKTRSKGDYLGTRVADRIGSLLTGGIVSVDQDKDKEAGALYMEGYYGLYEKMQAWYNNAEGKTEEEKNADFSQKVRENLMAGAFGKRGFFNEFLDELPPAAAIDYEQKRIAEESKKFRDRISLIEKMGDQHGIDGLDPALLNPDEEALSTSELGQYLKTSRLDNTFKRITTRDKNYQTGYDEYLEDEFKKGNTGILNVDIAKNYHEHLELEIAGQTKKIELAINALGDGATEDQIMKAFMDNGGTGLVMGDTTSKQSVQRNIEGADLKKEITDYEISRIKHYKDLKDALNKPVNELDALVRDLEENSNWADNASKTIKNAGPQELFLDNAFLNQIRSAVINGADDGREASEKLAEALDELNRLV